ncbi:MAG: DinB family protein [Anaerolineaceae bacterium]
MKKDTFLSKLNLLWENFQQSYADLDKEQMTQPGVTGNWSVKDIIAHVTTWEEESLQSLPLILQGQKLSKYSDKYGGIDAFNAQMTEAKANLTLNEVLASQYQTHERLITYLQEVDEAHFKSSTRFFRRLNMDAYYHYPEHTEAIKAWREKNLQN